MASKNLTQALTLAEGILAFARKNDQNPRVLLNRPEVVELLFTNISYSMTDGDAQKLTLENDVKVILKVNRLGFLVASVITPRVSKPVPSEPGPPLTPKTPATPVPSTHTPSVRNGSIPAKKSKAS